ncbi:GNAT family N-acetyltransferase [Niallia nealsonii]|uniref:GNAT family N-acetyltransferase n=1 Tax=Niallia nealsonii TaxID=115979 RepID=UPI001F43028E|nr:GNAT family N-acetyltransferase [Niallia nealsonii]
MKGEQDSILGRINVVDINILEKTGELGYRVGEKHGGKGVANFVLKLLLKNVCEEKKITRIYAKTAFINIASQKVLTKNGFQYIGTSKEKVAMSKKELSFLHYKWTKNP